MNAELLRALEALRAGRPVLVADASSRENEVDAILAANTATPEWMGWIIRHSSGLLCAPLPAALADRLSLPIMVERSEDVRGTAYTVTVDAAEGVTTGISATDRARTVRALAAADARASDLIRPGHVLPLRAVDGGVLERPGHTEAAVDLVRLAGTGEVGVIAELVRDDGEMLSFGEALELAAATDLVLLHVDDLVRHRREHPGFPAPRTQEEPQDHSQQRAAEAHVRGARR
ncbi:3,4-dihydroxy-2-butanone-4-phosphate synthase [Pseudoclavibacter sp. RFBG4]|uniref:3,4-dihydroxy-2-butanone-4-phosphate synthase n=1 Tax=Pseudoclavibacter sp. RFBG4 TaxID=2080575 RepID=UPI000CE925D3|nr:3,4-dihydroxy-2-butanone-4-phosphate synthase [Pseudoclavibacter sp. RFBG4]